MNKSDSSLMLKKDGNDFQSMLNHRILRIKGLYERINTVEDLINTFVKDAGKSQKTYAMYASAIRHFFSYIGHKHPWQITAGDIERHVKNIVSLNKGFY